MTLDPDTPSSETVYRVPARHHHCHLSNFDWTKTSIGVKGQKVVEQFLEEWKQGEAPHLILSGAPGLGKTHLAVGIYRAGVYETDLTKSVYIHVPSFVDFVHESFSNQNASNPYEVIHSASLLVLDDMFAFEWKEYASNQILPRLISIPYDNSAAVVTTTNYSKNQIQTRLHPHENSRLFANARIMKFKGEDQRL